MRPGWLGRATSLIKVTVATKTSQQVSILAGVQQVLRGKSYSNFRHKSEMFDASPITCGFFSQSE